MNHSIIKAYVKMIEAQKSQSQSQSQPKGDAKIIIDDKPIANTNTLAK